MSSPCHSFVDEIRFALDESEPLSACEKLKLLRLVADKMDFAQFSGNDVTYLEIRNRRVQYSNRSEARADLEALIRYYEGKCSRESRNVSSRNVAQFKRR